MGYLLLYYVYLHQHRLAEVARLGAVVVHVGNFENENTGAVSQILPTTTVKVFLVFAIILVCFKRKNIYIVKCFNSEW